jgi:hypothetical protein
MRTPTRPYGTAPYATFLNEPFRTTWGQFGSFNLNQTPNNWLSYGFFAGAIRNTFDYFNFDCLPDPVTGQCPQNPASRIFLQNPGPGLQLDASVFFELKPTDPFRVSLRYNKNRLSRNDNGRRSFDSDIISVRSTYQFTRFVFTRFRLDYDGNADGTGREKSFAGQLLFGWTPSPGTAFYVGYNDNLTRTPFSNIAGDYVDGFRRDSRTFFIRASYLFRKSF